MHKVITIPISKALNWITSRIYLVLFSIVERLSLKHAYELGRFIGGLLFYLSIQRRNIVEENVRILKAWADKRNLKNPLLDQDNKTISKKIYQSNAGNFFYSFALMNKSKATIEKHIKISDLGLLKKVNEKNQGMIMLFAHAGPFELTVMLQLLLPTIFNKSKTNIMYRSLNNSFTDKWYKRKRERFGAKLFSREDGFFKIIRKIRNGSFVILASDIRMQQGKKVELFDRLATTSKIPYTLHRATKAPVVAISYVKLDDVSWEIQFKEIAFPRDGVCSEIDLLKAANEHNEKKILKKPHD